MLRKIMTAVAAAALVFVGLAALLGLWQLVLVAAALAVWSALLLRRSHVEARP